MEREGHAIAPSLDNDPSDRKVFGKDGGHVHDPIFFVFARPETPHHRYESSLSDVSVCLSICLRSCESWLASEGGHVSICNPRLRDPIHVQAQRTQSWPPHTPKNPIMDICMNGSGSWAPLDPFNYY